MTDDSDWEQGCSESDEHESPEEESENDPSPNNTENIQEDSSPPEDNQKGIGNAPVDMLSNMNPPQFSINPKVLDNFTVDAKSLDHLTINPEQIQNFTIDPNKLDELTIDPDQVPKFTIDQKTLDQLTMDPEQMAQFAADPEQMAQFTIDLESVNQLVVDPIVIKDLEIDTGRLDHFTVDTNQIAQFTVDQERLNQLSSPAIDPELITSLQTLEQNITLDWYKVSAMFEQVGQTEQGGQNSKALSDPDPPKDDGFLSLFLNITSVVLLNREEEVPSESTQNLEEIINSSDIDEKIRLFKIMVQGLKGRGEFALAAATQYSCQVAVTLYFSPEQRDRDPDKE